MPASLLPAFVASPVRLTTAVGPLRLGIVDADVEGVAEGISVLLNRSIEDAREERGGHLPGWLVDDIKVNYISPEKIRTLWAANGHRFVLASDDDEIVGTVHIARRHDIILTVDRHRNNVPARDFPGFKPEGHHHVVNISVKHELRRAGLGRALIDGVIAHFRDCFDGDGLWVRADPPWHPGLTGLGFIHDPSMDLFLDESVARTAGLPHPVFNARYACDCVHPSPADPAALALRPARLQRLKLQYLSLTRAFTPAGTTTTTTTTTTTSTPRSSRLTTPDALDALALDHGRTRMVRPRAIIAPSDDGDIAAHLRHLGPGERLTVRGAGASVDGLCLGDDVILYTPTRATRGDSIVVDVERRTLTVDGHVSWADVVRRLAPHGLFPPVVTAHLAATVGGTLSVGGTGKGSHAAGLQADHALAVRVITGDGRVVDCTRTQAGWLHAAVLGGLGRFGVIARATLPLVARPPFVRPTRTDGLDDAGLTDALADAARAPEPLHITSFRAADSWSLVVTRACAAGDEGAVAFVDYLTGSRPPAPPVPQRWFHSVVPAAGLPTLLAATATTLELDAGDAVQVMPIRVTGPGRPSLLQLPGDVGEIVYGVAITRPLGDRDPARLVTEGLQLLEEAVGLGGRRTLTGAPPVHEHEWRRHLGPLVDEVLRARALADPRGVLPPLW